MFQMNFLRRSQSEACSSSSMPADACGIPESADDTQQDNSRSPPGNCLMDCSVDFWKDAVGFFKRHQLKHRSAVFNARFLMKSHTFVGSHRGVTELLVDKQDDFTYGYKEYMGALFGDVLVFAEDEHHRSMRDCLTPLFACTRYVRGDKRVEHFVDLLLAELPVNCPLCVYSAFKHIISVLLICILLRLHPVRDANVVNDVMQLAVHQWHGIVSVPLNVKLPFGAGSSGFGKAMDAGQALRDMTSDRFEQLSRMSSSLTVDNNDATTAEHGCTSSTNNSCLAHALLQSPFPNERCRLDHTVLLLTALVPKAAASLMTSLFIAESKWLAAGATHDKLSNVDSPELDAVLRETGRLWPAFFGGRRIAKRKVTIDGFDIPAGRGVVYNARAAQRDSEAFDDPLRFDHRRWIDGDSISQTSRIFVFGGGGRNCIGEPFITYLIKLVLSKFFQRFTFCHETPCDQLENTVYKWLPVSRPKTKPKLVLTMKQ